MADYYSIHPPEGKKGPKTYHAAKGGGKYQGKYGGSGQKPAHKSRISLVDRKVKQLSNKIHKFKKVVPGPASHSTYGGNDA